MNSVYEFARTLGNNCFFISEIELQGSKIAVLSRTMFDNQKDSGVQVVLVVWPLDNPDAMSRLIAAVIFRLAVTLLEP